MPRYIDADIVSEGIEKLQTELESNNDILWKKNKPIYKGLCYARGIINDTPTADVVEVVRCKDCEYWECVCGGTTGRCESPRNGLLYEYTDNFDYCSYGVRKDETTM